jgi:hypothetical protein
MHVPDARARRFSPTFRRPFESDQFPCRNENGLYGFCNSPLHRSRIDQLTGSGPITFPASKYPVPPSLSSVFFNSIFVLKSSSHALSSFFSLHCVFVTFGSRLKPARVHTSCPTSIPW